MTNYLVIIKILDKICALVYTLNQRKLTTQEQENEMNALLITLVLSNLTIVLAGLVAIFKNGEHNRWFHDFD